MTHICRAVYKWWDPSEAVHTSTSVPRFVICIKSFNHFGTSNCAINKPEYPENSIGCTVAHSPSSCPFLHWNSHSHLLPCTGSQSVILPLPKDPVSWLLLAPKSQLQWWAATLISRRDSSHDPWELGLEWQPFQAVLSLAISSAIDINTP